MKVSNKNIKNRGNFNISNVNGENNIIKNTYIGFIESEEYIKNKSNNKEKEKSYMNNKYINNDIINNQNKASNNQKIYEIKNGTNNEKKMMKDEVKKEKCKK